MSRLITLLFGAAAGAAAVHYFDRESGADNLHHFAQRLCR